MSQNAHVNTPWIRDNDAAVGPGDKLTTGQTFYTEIPSGEGAWNSSQVIYDAAFAGTFTVEATNFGSTEVAVQDDNTAAPDDLPVWSPVTTIAAVVVAAGAKGNSMINIGGVGHRRMRLKCVCTGTGVCHHRPHSKL